MAEKKTEVVEKEEKEVKTTKKAAAKKTAPKAEKTEEAVEKKAEVVENKTTKEEKEEGVKITLRQTEVLRHMILTEKTQKLLREQNVLTLLVLPKAQKSEIKRAVEVYFNVKVDAVRILNCDGRERTVGRFKGKTSKYRKAYCKVNKAFDLVKASEEAANAAAK